MSHDPTTHKRRMKEDCINSEVHTVKPAIRIAGVDGFDTAMA